MTNAAVKLSPPGYEALNTQTAVQYTARIKKIADALGGEPARWMCEEVGDGNLNLVFIITGTSGAVVVKQALPYVRMVGDSWPLPLYRAHYEHLALIEQYLHVPQRVPQTYHYDEPMALTIMEYLTPHIILRKELIAGKRFPNLAHQLGEFLAATLFHTSDLALTAEQKRQKMTPYLGNIAMCKITEDLIFDEPYFAAPMNRHTADIDDIAKSFRGDRALKLAAQAMKWRFLNAPEALCHGDLHTGSIMATDTDTRVIDPEFAFYGPIGFDIGMLLANFVMAYFAQDGHENSAGERADYKEWILSTALATCETFKSEFTRLWHQRAGEAYHTRVIVTDDSEAALTARMQQISDDVLGFCGVEIIRRILGLAHVADFESIADETRRAECERRALTFARELLVNKSAYPTYKEFTVLIKNQK